MIKRKNRRQAPPGIAISFIRPLFKLAGQNRQTGDPEKRFKPQ